MEKKKIILIGAGMRGKSYTDTMFAMISHFLPKIKFFRYKKNGGYYCRPSLMYSSCERSIPK